MAMIPAKCTNCGANIQVDESKEAGICEACGTAFITEKVINNYNTINNYHADVVNVYNISSEDFEIKAGVLTKYIGARDTVVIPNGVKVIGRGAFAHLHGLVSVQIPDSVSKIEPAAFSECKSLESISLSGSITKIPSYCFFSCESIKSIEIPFGCLEIDQGAFSCCQNLQYVALPNSLVEIREDAFHKCTSLQYITIPASVKRIQGYAVKHVDGVLCSIGSCFSGCSSLKGVTFEGANTDIICTPSRSLFDLYSYQIEILASEQWKKQNEKSLISIKPTSNNGGCYIATCVYGSYDCPQVWTLRRYRDDTLGATWYGRLFIRVYYAVSPTLVKWFGTTSWFRRMWQGKLNKMVKKLNGSGVQDTPYQDKEW